MGVTAFLVTLGTLLAAGAALPTVAAADPGPIVARPSTGVTADALPTVQIDGVVWDQEVVGDTVYAGGEFANARPAGAAPGTNLTPRSNLLAYNIRTGALITTFAPTLNGKVKALAVSPDGRTLYVGGSFTLVNNVNRYRMAAFDTATGALTSFAPAPNSVVNSISATDAAVYAGGAFTKVGASDRLRLAAFTTAGALTTWAPTADATVNAVLITPDGSRLIAAGSFANANNSPSPGLAAYTSTTGELRPWEANKVVRNSGTQAAMLSLSTDGQTVYSAGYWFGGPSGNFEGLLAADPNSGTIKWLADCHGDTYDGGAVNGVVYAVSHHHHCTNMGGFPDTNPRNRWLRANAFTVEATGTLARNDQCCYANFEGQPSPSIVNWFPEVNSGTFTGQNQGGWTTTGTKEYLLQGGEFTTVNGTRQQGLVRFAVPSLAPKKQGPRVAGAAFNPSLVAVSNRAVKVNWQANWDRDDQDLTYRVIRADQTATPLFVGQQVSQFWNRPAMSFTDSTVTAGSTYRYRVSATDPDGNVALSENVTITVPATVHPYLSQVVEDGATDYWRMSGSGPSYPNIAGRALLTASGGVSSSTDSALTGDSDTSANFDGATGSAGSSDQVTGPNTFSAEAWFKTTTTRGGKLLGFGNVASGTSSSYDRHVYMENSGRLAFGVYNGNTTVVRSASAYNDGDWHHVVAQLSPAGMVFYVDGVKVGGNTGVTAGQGYSGYWRVGADNLNAWPNRPSSDAFGGVIDEVAIYPSALTVTQVRDHYAKGGRTVNAPVAPSDAYGKAVYADDPTFFWRLDEASGTTAADSSPNGDSTGAYFGGVALKTDSNVSGSTGTAATFNGTDASVGSTASFNNPTSYSEELWFKTTTTSGGKLFGYGDQQSGLSNSYDRHVYMHTSGQLTFGVWTGQANTITSPRSYNDGQWHHLVASQNSAGMKLYLDGVQVGSDPQTQAQPYAGYWRVGGDRSWAADNYFKGVIDEVALYPGALSAARVQAHYAASPAAVAPNADPKAAFTSACTGAACTFDASGSTDDGSVASYAWDFGDGKSGTGAKPAHTYEASGTYQVKLTVTDDKDATGTISHAVTVTVAAPNADPVAAFTSSCTGAACTFDASGSTDDGSVASYAWDFGDGKTGTGVKPAHTYEASGTYQVKLTVTDDKDATGTASHAVTVTVAAPNAAPQAAFTSSCTDLVCAFDASTSTDAEGPLSSYAWDFGDGDTGTGAKPSHIFAAAGTYAVKLTVKDADDATDSVNGSVTVTAAAANQAPTAAFTSSSSVLTADFDASGSADPDGTIESYAWQFGDGSTGTGVKPSHAYAGTGTYAVKLTVTDDKGETKSVTKNVVVAPGAFAADAFDRTVTRWGTADQGGAWTHSGSTYSTNGSTGNVRLATAGTGATATLGSVSQRDVNVVADVGVDIAATGTGTYTTFLTRKVGTSDYRFTYRQMTNGVIRLTLAKTVSGTTTSLRDVNLTGVTHKAGDVFRVRFTVSGSGTTTLTGKAWLSGTAEPTAAQITATDATASLQGAGAFGIFTYLGSTVTALPVTIGIDNLLLS